MSWIFAEKDKSERSIHLSKERWAHVQKHLGMSNAIEHIKETLRYPDAITKFEYDPQIRFYYRYYKERKEYLFVSVKYLNGEGFIVTSFYTDKVK